MKVIIDIDCTKFTAWFTYTCSECGLFVGDSLGDFLEHPAFTTKGLLRKTKVPINCPYAGKKFEIPKITVDAKERP